MKILLFTSFLIIGSMAQSFAQGCSRELTLVNELLEKANLDQVITDPEAIEEDFNELKSTLSSISLASLKRHPESSFFERKSEKGTSQKESATNLRHHPDYG